MNAAGLFAARSTACWGMAGSQPAEPQCPLPTFAAAAGPPTLPMLISPVHHSLQMLPDMLLPLSPTLTHANCLAASVCPAFNLLPLVGPSPCNSLLPSQPAALLNACCLVLPSPSPSLHCLSRSLPSNCMPQPNQPVSQLSPCSRPSKARQRLEAALAAAVQQTLRAPRPYLCL
jgi:hypothetical protein